MPEKAKYLKSPHTSSLPHSLSFPFLLQSCLPMLIAPPPYTNSTSALDSPSTSHPPPTAPAAVASNAPSFYAATQRATPPTPTPPLPVNSHTSFDGPSSEAMYILPTYLPTYLPAFSPIIFPSSVPRPEPTFPVPVRSPCSPAASRAEPSEPN